MNAIRKSVATVAVAGTILGGGMAAPAFAQPQTGLVNVNVNVEDNEILSRNNVGVGVAANIAAAVCGLEVNAVVLSIVQDVVRGGDTFECEAKTGDSVVVIDQDQ